MLRNPLRLTALCAGLLLGANAMALSLGDLSQGDATGGLKDALTQGAQIAVKQLGVPGGFSNNPEVKIGLPGKLDKAAGALKMLGMGDQLTQLETSMNTAAESAVVQAQPILVDAVKKMSVSDAKGILSGGQDSATQYLDKSSRDQIRAKFLPIVKQSTDKVGVAQQYNALAKKAPMGLLGDKSASIENYVTEQALDGLFKMIAQQEETIRKDPAAAATSLAKKVFGTL
ncbi:DUF4197 family protein [Pseudomonas sp. CCM 7891]|uniref:DUF4197 family protein n=1 Tax=Pseudomonas karstica TaxID=1055468 RepID=A0A7X2RTP5_9PSED|nr:DUF4197 domain-containing protein [Pseudomonas karstica]MTD20346.1 DUF4197 family protein [Pseudomonas karstica]